MDLGIRIASARRALADRVDDLARTDPAALDASSWCGTWRGRDVLGHLVHLAESTQGSMLRDLARHGMLPNRTLDRVARTLGARPVPELTARLRAACDGSFHVVGSPAIVTLGEVLVHGEDILRPLGAEAAIAPAVAAPLMAVYRRLGGLAFHARAAARVTLVATDADARVGKGPEVRGRAIDILLLLANRLQVVDALEGPGVAHLRT